MLPIAGLFALGAAPAAVAAPAPIVIDNFSGATAGPRTVTPLPRPGESTQAPGTFTESGGAATMTMGGSGNRQGGVELSYALPDLDLTSQGSNTQFFLVFDSISRSGVDPAETAVQISISLTGGGVTGFYNTAISTTGPFNIVLNFSCAANPVCFSPQPDFAHVTAIDVTFLYPMAQESAANTTTVVLDSINTTPTGGVVPSPATATLTAPEDPFYGPTGTTIDFPLAFLSDGGPTQVYSASTSGPLTAADITVGGTAGGVGAFSVTPDGLGYVVHVGPLTSSGTVVVSVPAGAAVDAWAQATLASTEAVTHFVIPTPPIFTAATPPPATVGVAYTYQFAASGVPAPSYSLGAGTLPTGMALSVSGVLGGVPAAGTGGSYPLTVVATNSAGSVQSSPTLIVNEAPAITSAASATFVAGTAGAFTITTSGFPTPGLTLDGALPQGLNFTDNGDGTGTVSGMPAVAAAGSATVTVNAANTAGMVQQSLQLDVTSAPDFTSALAFDLVVGTPATITIDTSGRPLPTIAALDALPAGLSFTDNGDGTATISGTPTSAGVIETLLQAQNIVGVRDATLRITVREVPAITSAASATFVAGTAGAFTITTSGFPTPGLTLDGALPQGLNFTDNGDGTGTVSGMPAVAAAGSATVTVNAANTVGVVQQSLQLDVTSAPAFTSALAFDLVVGTPATITIDTSGRPLPTIAALDALPAGLSFTDNGDGTATISGTPTSAGVTETLLQAQNTLGVQDATLKITVREVPAITSADTAIFVVGTAGTFTVTASGSPTPALAVEDGALPSGITFVDNGDGTATLSGTPAAGTGKDYPLTISATVAGLPAVTQGFTLKVKQEPVFTSPATATFVAGQPGSFTVVTEAVPTASLELVGTLPPGLAFVDNGDGTATIFGTPAVDATGTYSVTVNATNDLVDPPQTLTVVVAAAPAVPGDTGGSASGGSGTAASGDLPVTGADVPWGLAALAAALLALGGGLFFATRRRRAS